MQRVWHTNEAHQRYEQEYLGQLMDKFIYCPICDKNTFHLLSRLVSVGTVYSCMWCGHQEVVLDDTTNTILNPDWDY